MHPDACWARITFDSSVYEPAERHRDALGDARAAHRAWASRPAPSRCSTSSTSRRPTRGRSSRRSAGCSTTSRSRLGQFLTERRLRSMARNWKDAIEQAPADERRDWRVIIEFLRRTDPHLLTRVSRRMINYLVWSGIDEAENLLEHLSANQREPGGVGREPPHRAGQRRRTDAGDERGVPRRRQQPHRGRDRPRHRAVGEGRQERVPGRGGREPAHVAHRNCRRPRALRADGLRRQGAVALGAARPARVARAALPHRRPRVHQHRQELPARPRLLRHRAARRVAGGLARQAGRQELGPPARLPHRAALGGVRRRDRRVQDAEDVVHHVGRPSGVPRSQPPAGHPQPEVPRGRAGPEGIPAHRPGVQELGAARRRS